MIPLEKQLTSLELSKQLKKFGVKQDSLFYWWHSEVEGWVVLYNPATIYRNEGYSAFTVAELGQELPSFAERRGEKYYLYITRTNKTEYSSLPDFYVGYRDIHGNHFLHSEREDNEANARAKMLIWLIKHKLMDAK